MVPVASGVGSGALRRRRRPPGPGSGRRPGCCPEAASMVQVPAAEAYCTVQPESDTARPPRLYSSMKSLVRGAGVAAAAVHLADRDVGGGRERGARRRDEQRADDGRRSGNRRQPAGSSSALLHWDPSDLRGTERVKDCQFTVKLRASQRQHQVNDWHGPAHLRSPLAHGTPVFPAQRFHAHALGPGCTPVSGFAARAGVHRAPPVPALAHRAPGRPTSTRSSAWPSRPGRPC